MKKIPVNLKKEPLLEAVWEIRFNSEKSSIAELIPGLLFNSLNEQYTNIIRLPTADIPARIVEHDPNLRYVPKIRLDGGNRAVQIGEHVVSLSCRRPYSGWKAFATDIRALIGLLRDFKLIDKLERFSLKYIDLIELNHPPNIRCLNLELKLGENEINIQPVNLRTEFEVGSFIHIVQIQSPAEVTLLNLADKLTGVLVSTDTIYMMKENEFWDDIEIHLDAAHSASHKFFFSLLSVDSLEKLEPEY